MRASATCAAAAFLAFALFCLPVRAQVSGADHADRMAGEIALKRAQLRAAKCGPTRGMAVTQPLTQPLVGPLPAGVYPTTGSAGPVRCEK